jgi:hypothetical protein
VDAIDGELGSKESERESVSSGRKRRSSDQSYL